MLTISRPNHYQDKVFATITSITTLSPPSFLSLMLQPRSLYKEVHSAKETRPPPPSEQPTPRSPPYSAPKTHSTDPSSS